VANALQRQNVILPAGDVKIGNKDYTLTMNNSPDVISAINNFPVKDVNGRTVFMSDVAHVHDGFQVQTNSVSVDGTSGALMTIRKTGGVSTLAVIDGVREALVDIKKILPESVSIKPVFDQSVFVKAALNSVIMGGCMAAGLTALMIMLFLGNWRLTLITVTSIPLSITMAVLVLYLTGQTLNTMTLGGFALAVGILVDDSTVVIENIDRHLHLGKPLERAIIEGREEVGLATVLATFCICIVFIPIFLLQGTPKYLFSPLALSVCASLPASLILSFTQVPVMFKYLMRNVHVTHEHYQDREPHGLHVFIRHFESFFDRTHKVYEQYLQWALTEARQTVGFFLVLMVVSLLLFPALGRDFFPDVDAGQMRLHVRAPAGTRLETTQVDMAQVEAAIREIVGNGQIDTILDNIGLPYSGINIALSDSATIGPMDGEILISLKEKHIATAKLMTKLREELPKRFASLQFFFQPADIVDQVLNFGQPAPIDIRVTGPDNKEDYELAQKILHDITPIAGVVDAHIFQVPDAPALIVDVDRTIASQLGLSQRAAASDLLINTNSSGQTAPNFWVEPGNGVSYPLVVQMPTYRINSEQDLWTLPITSDGGKDQQLLMNVANFTRGTAPMVMSQYNIRPVFDINANVAGRDLNSVATDIDKIIAKDKPDAAKAIHVTLSGQIETMRVSYQGIFGGMAFAVVLVYLFMVINFQSWLSPVIVLMAAPFALSGICWMLYLTQTHLSVPALMGTLMCMGLSTANSILVVTFANQRLNAGLSSWQAALEAGSIRLRPVLMTAGAMIIGMIPMALGIGEGGEQNAPLARAVIGGLMFATFATLVLVPVMFGLLKQKSSPSSNPSSEQDAHAHS
jgi:multidrug efflux pump subunit AcrB